jgi:hypothetical protein
VGRTDRNTAEIEALYRQHGAALLLFASAISAIEVALRMRFTKYS